MVKSLKYASGNKTDSTNSYFSNYQPKMDDTTCKINKNTKVKLKNTSNYLSMFRDGNFIP